jgi:hypothetical protein
MPECLVTHEPPWLDQTLAGKQQKRTKKSPYFLEKVYIIFPTIYGELFHPPTIKSDILPSELSKTDQITPQIVLDGGFTTVARFYLFLFYLFPLNI